MVAAAQRAVIALARFKAMDLETPASITTEEALICRVAVRRVERTWLTMARAKNPRTRLWMVVAALDLVARRRRAASWTACWMIVAATCCRRSRLSVMTERRRAARGILVSAVTLGLRWVGGLAGKTSK